MERIIKTTGILSNSAWSGTTLKTTNSIDVSCSADAGGSTVMVNGSRIMTLTATRDEVNDYNV